MMSINGYIIPMQIVSVLAAIFSVLITCSIAFRIFALTKSSKLSKELITRTNSWWYIATGVAILITAPPIVGTCLIGYISFVALREMFSISQFRESDRGALFAAYFAIPVQYYLAYKMYYEEFLIFIPVGMFMVLPSILVLSGNTHRVGRSMSLIPTVLLLTVFMLSHLVLLFHVEAPGFTAGGGGLIIYLIMVTAFNDVFQFAWGKMLGKHKILPKVSPNKTWEGFIGGVLTTALMSFFLKFLTPLSGLQALAMGLLLGILGFIGDSLISAVKRDLKIKDTDDLIPGHGGAMDRLDSIVVTAPAFYHLLNYFIEM